MTTPRTPVSKKTTTKKSTTATTFAHPASTAKDTPKATPKGRSKTIAATPSTPPTTRTKQAKPIAEASTLKKTRASNKTTAKKTVTPEERYQMIMTAAYFLAERHGFSSGRALEDWIAAEKEIDNMLK